MSIVHVQIINGDTNVIAPNEAARCAGRRREEWSRGSGAEKLKLRARFNVPSNTL